MRSLNQFILIFATLVGIQPSAHGQSKFSLSVSLAPEYAHSNVSIIIPDFNPTNPGYTSLKSKTNLLNYTLGLTAGYSFSEKWSVTSGLWATHPFAGSISIFQGPQLAKVAYKYERPFNNQYRVPIMVNLRPSTNRISPYISVGTTLDFRKSAYVDIDGSGNEERVKFGKAVTFNPIVGIGVISNLKENLSLVVQPTFQYLIQSQKGYDYRRSYLVGLQVQLMFRL